MPELGALLLSTQPTSAPGDLLNLALNAGAIAPEGAVLLAMLATLLVDLAGEQVAIRWVPLICYAGLGGALALLAFQWNAPLEPSFLGAFLPDHLALSVASYLLSGYRKRDARSSEAALKCLLVGSAAAAVFLYGASLLYGLSGSTSLEVIGLALINSPTPLAALALVFVLATVAFKIAAVPFHQWTPDVYEGSPTPVVAFLSVGSKAAGFALALRILVGCFGAFDAQWKLLFTVLALLSMTLGNVVALAQTSMKRMLAYSSIGQAGFVMIGLVCGTEEGFAAMVLYMAAYLFMNLGAFACIILFSIRTGSDRISDYAGLYQKDPLITLGLSLCLLSLGGIPPMLGFFGKIYLFFAGWADHQYLLVVVGLITSVVSIYYYIGVIKMMVVKEPQEASDVVKAYPEVQWNTIGLPSLRFALVACVVVTAVGGILSNPIFQWANSAVEGTPLLRQAVALSSQQPLG